MASNIKDENYKNSLENAPGWKAILEHMEKFYPDQPNPLQVTTVLKYWLGGKDILDYVSMYSNDGDAKENIPPHWHYISYGLSDLHGDERVYERRYTRSGMGFELTFRLKKTPEEVEKQHDKLCKQIPPTWPVCLLQTIARYCFGTGNRLCHGDNIPLHRSINEQSDTSLKNFLVTQDYQLGNITTALGSVEFCQLVGVTDDELEQGTVYNSRLLLNYMSQSVETGGKWLVTDLNRKDSIFKILPDMQVLLQEDLEKEGSDLAGANSYFSYREIKKGVKIKEECDFDNSVDEAMPNEFSTMTNSVNFGDTKLQNANQLNDLNCQFKDTPVHLDGIELSFPGNMVKYLLLALKDRIRHGRHFTFKSQKHSLTLLAESVTGAAVSKEFPYKVLGFWIQVLLPNDLVPRMLEMLHPALAKSDFPERRLQFEWPDKNLKIIIENSHTNF